MADDGLIPAYLRELRFSLARLPDADDTIAEAQDHLLESVDRLLSTGQSLLQAEAEALARFGSAALIATVCHAQSTQGAAVPTTRTRLAGLAGLLAPLLLVAGQVGNVSIERGAGHGVFVVMLTLAFPMFAFGLWGLRERHGGLGRLGRAALALTIATPFLSLAANWAAPLVFIPLVSVAIIIFAVEMLRASVLPFAPLVLLAAGGIAGLASIAAAGAITAGGGDAGAYVALLLVPIALTAGATAWLGWHLWNETAAATRRGTPPIAVAGSTDTAP